MTPHIGHVLERQSAPYPYHGRREQNGFRGLCLASPARPEVVPGRYLAGANPLLIIGKPTATTAGYTRYLAACENRLHATVAKGMMCHGILLICQFPFAQRETNGPNTCKPQRGSGIAFHCRRATHLQEIKRTLYNYTLLVPWDRI